MLLADKLSGRSTSMRSFHFGISNARLGVEQHVEFTKSLTPQNQWFSEWHSLSAVHQFMTKLTSSTPNAYNLTIGARSPNPIKGVKICAPRRGRNVRDIKQVIILSGHQAHEWTGVSVGLYVASMIARRPLTGADVVVIPTVNPTQYDLHYQANSIFASLSSTLSSDLAELSCSRKSNPLPQLQSADVDVLRGGPLKSYVDRLGRRFVRIVQHLDAGRVATTFQAHQQNAPSLSPSFQPFSNCPTLGALGEGDVLGLALRRPQPSYIIELRDRSKTLQDDAIIEKGEEILAGLHQLVEGAHM